MINIFNFNFYSPIILPFNNFNSNFIFIILFIYFSLHLNFLNHFLNHYFYLLSILNLINYVNTSAILFIQNLIVYLFIHIIVFNLLMDSILMINLLNLLLMLLMSLCCYLKILIY